MLFKHRGSCVKTLYNEKERILCYVLVILSILEFFSDGFSFSINRKLTLFKLRFESYSAMIVQQFEQIHENHTF